MESSTKFFFIWPVIIIIWCINFRIVLNLEGIYNIINIRNETIDFSVTIIIYSILSFLWPVWLFSIYLFERIDNVFQDKN